VWAAVRHQQDDAAALLRTRGSTLKLNAMDVGVALCEAAFANDMGALMRLVENGIDPGSWDPVPIHET
jgi:hypothetical protein